MSIWWVIGLISAVFFGVTYYLYTLGVFDKINVNEGPHSHGGYFIYREYIGPYQGVTEELQKVNVDAKPYFDKFRGVKCAGIYYDNPQLVADKSKCRASIGVIIPAKETYVEVAKLMDLNKFKYADLPSTTSARIYWPYHNKLSFFFLGIRGIREILRYISSRKLAKEEETGPVVEIYHFQQGNKMIECHVLFGGQRDKYLLTTAPCPRMKDRIKSD